MNQLLMAMTGSLDGAVDNSITDARPVAPEPRDWMRILTRYREPRVGRSVRELAVTVVPFVAIWLLMLLSLRLSYLLCLLLAVPAAGFLIRLFMIQHDCGHGSFFRRRHQNDWLGRVLGVLTLTPYEHWRHKHAIHHATSGNLDRRGVGDVPTLTVTEFRALSGWQKVGYRLARHPVIILTVIPTYLFVLRHRLPDPIIGGKPSAWVSTMATNLGIVAVVALAMALVGWKAFVLVQVPITLLASAVGIWLFWVQHQFEDTYWRPHERWNALSGGFHGSSHFDLPPVLRWITANIGVHHVHHLCSGIPSYRLSEVLRDHPELRGVNRLTLRQSFQCFRLALWDERGNRLVGLRQAMAMSAA